jgi:hypothetical protein
MTNNDLGSTRGQVTSALLALLLSVSAIGAVLYFFGKARIQSMQAALGLSVGVIESSPAQYASAGIEVIVPFGLLSLLALVLVMFVYYVSIRSALRKPRYSRTRKNLRRVLAVVTALAGCGLILVVIGIVRPDGFGRDLGLALPVMLAACAGYLAWRCFNGMSRLMSYLLACAATIGVLWSSALYGKVVGHRFAEHFATHAIEQAEVEILSHDRLHLVGPGVTEEELSQQSTSLYRYCYRGLRHLMASGKYYVFAPAEWKLGEELFYVPTDAVMRFDTARAGFGSSSSKC